MEDSAGIICQISSVKDMLDQVNEDIEANIQITREVESEIVKCIKIDNSLSFRESDLTRSLFLLMFQINGLLALTGDSRKSVQSLEEQLSLLRTEREEMLKRMNEKREGFKNLCLQFQEDINKGERGNLLSDKELLENEVCLMEKKNQALKNSMLVFMEEILAELNNSNDDLNAEIRSGNEENENLLKEIDDLKLQCFQR